MNLSQLEVFVAIAESGSFTNAANRVGLTRSAASHAIANLEAELGVILLERERGSAAPTAIGECILRHAREILGTVETIQQEAAAARGLKSGKLRIGIISSISASMLSGILRKFSHEYPHIELVTFEGSSSEVENWILSSTVDVGFVLRPKNGIERLIIGPDEVRVIVPATHPLRKHKSIPIERLMQEQFIMPKMACDFLDISPLNANDLRKHHEASEVQTILAMVREGLGITTLPEMLLPDQLDGLYLLSFEPPLRLMFGLGVRSLRSASPAARIFIQSAQMWAWANGFEHIPEPTAVLHDSYE
jgi:DNA-binding transcriptional LysR family regulator